MSTTIKTAAIAIILFAAGTAVNLAFARRGFLPLDQSIVFDGGWRILSGQVPFRDFSAPSGLVPSAMQAAVFRVFGVTWFAYCLHASVINGLFCVLIYVLLRLCGSPQVPAAVFGGLTAVFFYPPTGTPFMDQHSFFFMTCMFVAAAAGTASTNRTMEVVAWSAVPPLFVLGYLSGQIPVSFGALGVAAWVACHPRRAPRWLAALAAGTLATAIVMGLGCWFWSIDVSTVVRHVVTMPLEIGRIRSVRPGVVGAARLLLATLVQLPAWLKIWSFYAALAAAIVLAVNPRAVARRPLLACVFFSALLGTIGFAAYTRTLLVTGAGLMMLLPGIAAVAMRDALPKAAGTVVMTALCVLAAWDARAFVKTVDAPRLSLVGYVASEAAQAEGRLPPGLEFMRWSRGEAAYDLDELNALIRYLRDSDGNFLLIGDASILYGLAGKPSVSPVLWFDQALTIPLKSTPAFAAFESEVLQRVGRDHVRRIVVEPNFAGLTPDDCPRLFARTNSGACGVTVFGEATVFELCAELR